MDENNNPLLVEGKKGFSDPRLRESMEDNQNILLSGIINYNRTFAENHSVNVLAGAERITGKGDSFEAFRRYFISTAIDELFAGGQDEINNTGKGYKEARLNYFGRVNYSYKSKYRPNLYGDTRAHISSTIPISSASSQVFHWVTSSPKRTSLRRRCLSSTLPKSVLPGERRATI